MTDRIITTGRVIAVERDHMRVRLDANGAVVLAKLSGRMRRCRIKCIVNDAVDVELSPCSIERARIIYRRKD